MNGRLARQRWEPVLIGAAVLVCLILLVASILSARIPFWIGVVGGEFVVAALAAIAVLETGRGRSLIAGSLLLLVACWSQFLFAFFLQPAQCPSFSTDIMTLAIMLGPAMFHYRVAFASSIVLAMLVVRFALRVPIRYRAIIVASLLALTAFVAIELSQGATSNCGPQF